MFMGGTVIPSADKWYNTGMAGLKQIMYGVTDGVPGGTVELHRLLVVFHGGRVVVCEEV